MSEEEWKIPSAALTAHTSVGFLPTTSKTPTGGVKADFKGVSAAGCEGVYGAFNKTEKCHVGFEPSKFERTESAVTDWLAGADDVLALPGEVPTCW